MTVRDGAPPRRKRFRDWPPRWIAVMWFAGAGLQLLVLLVVPPLLGWKRADSAEFAWDVSQPDSRWENRGLIQPDTLPPRHVSVIRREIAPGDTIVRAEQDSRWIQSRTTGGIVRMSPDVEKAAVPIGEIVAGILGALERALLQLLVLVFTLPAILVATTLTWLVLRRPPSRADADQTIRVGPR